jgi:hypothetical protein
MSTPGFAAEFSLYDSDKSYRLTAGSSPYLVRQMVTPQIKCEEYECAPGVSDAQGRVLWPPTYCMRCEGARLRPV